MATDGKLTVHVEVADWKDHEIGAKSREAFMEHLRNALEDTAELVADHHKLAVKVQVEEE